MKKIVIVLILFICLGLFYKTNAVEINVSGTGSALLTGYDINSVRNSQDTKMSKKAKNSNYEVLQTQQIKEAARQAETRKKQDTRLNAAVRASVVSEAQENALKNALTTLINRTLGANASKNAEVQEKFEELYSQADVYIIDKEYTGETKDNSYIAKINMIVDETAFRELISDLGIALNTQKVRANSIIVVMDEFFAQPSNLKDAVLTEETTTYKYDYDKKLKDKETSSASKYNSSSASGRSSSNYNVNAKSKGNYKANASAGYANQYGGGGYSAGASGSHNASYKGSGSNSSNYNRTSASGAKSNYGHFVDYSENEHEFFQNIKKYDVTSPKAENLNYTQPALVNAFTEYDIRSIDNDIFKSKFFKGSYVTADKLQNSEVLAKYVDFARNTAKADFFAIGVSYITDNGVNENTGRNTCDGNVFVKIYSTQDGEVIASGNFTETASGNTADQARVAVANKIGIELGETLSKKIQDYWKKRMMYGSEYFVEIRGNFLPVERIQIANAIKNVEGISTVTQKTVDSTKLEYSVNYKGNDGIADLIFTNFIESNLSNKFNKYDYKVKSNRIIFLQIGNSVDNL